MKTFWGPSPADVARARAKGIDPWGYAMWRADLRTLYKELVPSNCRLASKCTGTVRDWMVDDIAPSIRLGELPRVL